MKPIQVEYHLEVPDVMENSMEVSDFAMLLKEHCIEYDRMFVNLKHVYVPEEFRRQGIASLAIKGVAQQFNDSLIITLSGADKIEYVEEPTHETYAELLDKLDKFYTSNSFVNISSLVGGYRCHNLYMYVGNRVGKQVYKILCEDN